MPEHVDFNLFLAAWLTILFPYILIGLALCIASIFLWRLCRHYSRPSAVRQREHQQWEIRRLKEWIGIRREVLDRGAASLGIVTEGKGAEGPDGWMAIREDRYAEDERLQELKARLEELQREEEVRSIVDLEDGRRTD